VLSTLSGIVISNCCFTRLYLINSPVVRAETLKFQERGVKDIIKDVFLPWYNAHRFLLQNIQQMERVRQYISFFFLIASGLVTQYFLCPCCTTMLYCKMQSVSVWITTYVESCRQQHVAQSWTPVYFVEHVAATCNTVAMDNGYVASWRNMLPVLLCIYLTDKTTFE